jgi:NAD(P)-dependent dehydrogenase (short-subunit alcohol dehydrogenase family)
MSKLAVVTGGVGALGRAVAERFAAANYDVLVTAIDEAEQTGYGGPGEAQVVNLVDLAATQRWAHAIGRPVHAAALIAGGFAMRSIPEISEGDFERMFDLNVKTAANALSVLTPLLAQAGGAGVVLVGAAAFEGASGMALYAASKAAVVSLSRSAALELQESGIRVNCVLPNIIDTPTNRASMPNANYDKWAKPAEIAEVIAYLCSDSASVVSGNAIRLGRTVP